MRIRTLLLFDMKLYAVIRPTCVGGVNRLLTRAFITLANKAFLKFNPWLLKREIKTRLVVAVGSVMYIFFFKVERNSKITLYYVV